MPEAILFQPEVDDRIAVIGAGIAGIAVVGALLDAETKPEQITWIDPSFKVGDIGTLWRNVPGNTKISTLQKYLNGCGAFEYDETDERYDLNLQGAEDPNRTCHLGLFADVLDDITHRLKGRVQSISGFVTAVTATPEYLEIEHQTDDLKRSTASSRLIIASGTEPKVLPNALPHASQIDLAYALNPEQVADFVYDGDVIALFGSSHSAMLAMKNLTERCSDKNITIINFYRSPLRFSYECDGKIYYDNTGLKGEVAEWTEQCFGENGNPPGNVVRVPSDEQHLLQYGPLCNKSIHAVGLERRALPINGSIDYSYDSCTGEIIPGKIWGVGAAFPECGIDPSGEMEYRVGAGKFIDYIQNKIVPSVVGSKISA